MNVTDALRLRKSVRVFLDKAVEEEKIEAILSAARHAPSGANTQPWQVAVVAGESKQKLQSRLESAFRNGDKGKADYVYYPEQWIEPYKSRRIDCGMQLYAALNIAREDKQRRLEQWVANYRAFDAPVLLLFFLDKRMQTGSFMDYGMFLQSIMLVALEQGMATCPQAAFADYAEIVKSTLGYPEDSVLLCGMSLGYEDRSAPVNNYRTPRADVDTFTRYFK
ncbi:MAG: nitroreductase [Gammaproteobacteria bacterium]|nr:nitroreductase [Gammaproteobacteria bacterium]NNJ97953.1 nitroreductase [Gammaproteobacteria bacterium]